MALSLGRTPSQSSHSCWQGNDKYSEGDFEKVRKATLLMREAALRRIQPTNSLSYRYERLPSREQPTHPCMQALEEYEFALDMFK